MQFIFTKGAGKFDQLLVQREDQSGERIECPKQGIIPHDMVHFAVEKTLSLRGFMTRVAHGEAAQFTMQHEAQSESVERLVEVFQGDGWSGGSTPAAELVAMYRLTCEARQCLVLPIDEAAIDAVRQQIAELTQAWQAVPVGGHLTLLL